MALSGPLRHWPHHAVTDALVTNRRPEANVLSTRRLTLRPWRVDDAPAALDVYGHAEVTRWLSPEMDQVPDVRVL